MTPRRHPWNTSFEWRRPTTAPRRLSPAEVDAFDRDGWLVVAGLLDTATLERVTAELDVIEAKTAAFVQVQPESRHVLSESGAVTFAPHLVPRCAVAHDLSRSEPAHVEGTLAHHHVHPLGLRCIDDHPHATPAPVRAGGAVVFSSLTPHRTGPNTTDAARKTYILQYAPDGVEALQGDPAAGPPSRRVVQDDPERQYLVLRGGVPVGATA